MPRITKHVQNDRRGTHNLSDEEISVIAEAAAKKAIEIIMADVGRTVVRKFFWAIGLVVLGLLGWIAGTGHLKLE